MGIISFRNQFQFSHKILSIIIDQNIDINIIGYLDKKPDVSDDDIFSNSSNNIEFTNYFYGEKSAELRKKYKQLDKLLKHKKYEIPEDFKGVYVETIFTNELIALYIKEKDKNIKRCFSFITKKNEYIYKLIDEKGKETEEIYTLEQLNDIKIHDMEKSDRGPDISFEKLPTEKVTERISLYNNKFEQDINDVNELIIEKDFVPTCSCSDIHYYYNLNGNGLRMNLKRNLFDYIKLYSCCQSEIMKVELRLKDTLKNYATIKKEKNCAICGTHFGFGVFFEKAKKVKRFAIRKSIKSSDVNSIEIYDSGNLTFTIIEKNSGKNYEIKNGIDRNIGSIDKIEENDENNKIKKILYKIKFLENNQIEYQQKMVIIFAGILIQK